MTISANTVWEVRSGGSDNNGGGFVTGASGTDRSQQDAAHATLTALSLVHTTTTQINVSLVDYTVTAADIGNILQITGGTATAGLYQITASDTVNNRWTVDRSAGTAAQTVVGAMGGAFASLGKAAPSATVDGNLIWQKADGTYTMTTATPGAGGPIVTASTIRVKIEGYTTTRGDRAGRPVNSAGAVTGITMLTGNGSDLQIFAHLKFDCNSGSGNSGITIANIRWLAEDCLVTNANQASQVGILLSAAGGVVACGAQGCTIGFSGTAVGANFVRCWADACGTNFSHTSTGWFIECAGTDATGDTFLFASTNGGGCIGCTAEGGGGDGYDLGSVIKQLLYCAATNNTGVAYNNGSVSYANYCANYNNSSRGTLAMDLNPITLSGDPWTDAAADDLRPNNTAGAGASLRNIAGDVYGQTDNRDIGAVQHADPAGGGASKGKLSGLLS